MITVLPGMAMQIRMLPLMHVRTYVEGQTIFGVHKQTTNLTMQKNAPSRKRKESKNNVKKAKQKKKIKKLRLGHHGYSYGNLQPDCIDLGIIISAPKTWQL